MALAMSVEQFIHGGIIFAVVASVVMMLPVVVALIDNRINDRALQKLHKENVERGITLESVYGAEGYQGDTEPRLSGDLSVR